MTRALCHLALYAGLAVPSPLVGQQTSEDHRVPGRVTVYRDDYGVPHIYAAREEDGFFGLGYAQAQDQLEYILRVFLAVRGEQAAAFGSAFAPADAMARQWMHVEEGKAGFDRLPAQLKLNYAHYVEGLRRYMAEHPDATPDWAPDLHPWDAVALTRGVLWTSYNAGDGLRDCQRGGLTLGAAVTDALRAARQYASNEWILAPWRTADNAMIVLSDPHGGIDGSVFYESRIDAGDLKSAGYSFGPALVLVHTRYLSWGMTTGAPDVADCYEVEVDPGDSLRYRYDGEWQAMETRNVTIAVKDGTPVERTFAYTRHNEILSPVVARSPGKAYVVSTPYMHDAGAFDREVYDLNRARTIDDVREAMAQLGMFAQNLMFGDRDGRSLYVRSGRTPRRPEGFDWSRPVSGNTSATAWNGVHPLDELVQLESPLQGFMTNNNVAPDMMLENSPLTADRYPSYLFNDRPGRTNSRGVRAVEVLSSAYRVTVDDAIELALDEKWVGTESWQDALRKAVREHTRLVADKPVTFRRFLQRLLRFDGMARSESVAALNYFYWRDAIRTMPGLSDRDREALREPRWRKPALDAALGRVLLDAVDTAIVTMQAGHGTTDLPYGEVFRITVGDRSWPIGAGTLQPIDEISCALQLSCILTLRAMTFRPPDVTGHRQLWLGSRSFRLVIFTEPLQSFTLHNFGQSTDPRSPHFADQARLSSQRRLKPTYFYERDLLNHVTAKTVLTVRD